MHLHLSVLESAEELILRLTFIRHGTGSVGYRLYQPTEVWETRRFSHRNACPGEDDQSVVAQGIQEGFGEVNIRYLHGRVDRYSLA